MPPGVRSALGPVSIPAPACRLSTELTCVPFPSGLQNPMSPRWVPLLASWPSQASNTEELPQDLPGALSPGISEAAVYSDQAAYGRDPLRPRHSCQDKDFHLGSLGCLPLSLDEGWRAKGRGGALSHHG